MDEKHIIADGICCAEEEIDTSYYYYDLSSHSEYNYARRGMY